MQRQMPTDEQLKQFLTTEQVSDIRHRLARRELEPNLIVMAYKGFLGGSEDVKRSLMRLLFPPPFLVTAGPPGKYVVATCESVTFVPSTATTTQFDPNEVNLARGGSERFRHEEEWPLEPGCTV